jgi:hypothetical protein
MIRNLFYSSRAKSVDTVIIDGKVVLDGGTFPGLDERETLSHINEASLALISRMGKTIEPNRAARASRRS